MAQQQLVNDQAARQNIAPSTSTPSPSPSDQHQQRQRRQHQQPRRHDGRFPAVAPSLAPWDRSIELTNSANAPTAESWVEVASQPSSSSLSSIGDEIVTTGLQVGNPYQYQHPQNLARRRRRPQQASRSLPRRQTAPSASGTSSQEEYDESDSDSAEDRVLASSAENLIHSPSSADEAGVDSDDDDDDDNNGDNDDDGDDATALGRATDNNNNNNNNKGRPTFEPQPNAFSHPPAPHPGRRSYSTNAAMAPHPHSGFARRSFPGRSQARAQRGPSFMSPSVREDNDAALRASLTTLLSCAAAARGLPKSGDDAAESRRGAAGNGVSPSNQPMELHFVPEAELMEESKAPAQAPPQAHGQTQGQAQGQAQAQLQTQGRPRQDDAKRASPTGSSPKAQSDTLENHGKRPVTDSRSARVAKKKRAATAGAGTGQQGVVADETLISPTLLTWVVSAGVLVLVSVVGFSAGYVIGREVGRQESLAASIGGGLNDTASSSGREVIRSSGGSLRRFKWGAVGRSIVAAA